MNNSTRDIIKESWYLINEETENFSILYEKLLVYLPESRSLFSNEIEKQSKQLKESFAFIVENIDCEDSLIEASRELGKAHSSLEIDSTHYKFLIVSFIESIQEILGVTYEEKYGEAWRQVLELVSQTMLDSKKH